MTKDYQEYIKNLRMGGTKAPETQTKLIQGCKDLLTYGTIFASGELNERQFKENSKIMIHDYQKHRNLITTS